MIGFRLDANKYIASGHMMRCIIIARQCVKMGEKCVFLLASDENVDVLKKYDMDYYILNTEWNDWDRSITSVIKCVKKWI